MKTCKFQLSCLGNSYLLASRVELESFLKFVKEAPSLVIRRYL
jgi:hypothetical protein